MHLQNRFPQRRIPLYSPLGRLTLPPPRVLGPFLGSTFGGGSDRLDRVREGQRGGPGTRHVSHRGAAGAGDLSPGKRSCRGPRKEWGPLHWRGPRKGWRATSLGCRTGGVSWGPLPTLWRELSPPHCRAPEVDRPGRGKGGNGQKVLSPSPFSLSPIRSEGSPPTAIQGRPRRSKGRCPHRGLATCCHSCFWKGPQPKTNPAPEMKQARGPQGWLARELERCQGRLQSRRQGHDPACSSTG